MCAFSAGQIGLPQFVESDDEADGIHFYSLNPFDRVRGIWEAARGEGFARGGAGNCAVTVFGRKFYPLDGRYSQKRRSVKKT
ncbi:MAG: hypothetical protein V3S41_05860 [Spirochaetia bacterium]